MDDDHVPVKNFNFTLPSSVITPPVPPKEDDSRLDKEIEQEEDAHMKMQSQSRLADFTAELTAAIRASSSSIRGEDLTRAMRVQQADFAAAAIKDSSIGGKGQQSQLPDLAAAAAIKDSSINQRGIGIGMDDDDDDDYVPVPLFKDVSLPPSWIRTPRPKEDDEAKRNYMFEERKRIVEREQYAKDMDSTQGFEVGEYPYLSRQLVGNFVTRYYCPPETTITDYELYKLTSFANLAIGRYDITHNTKFDNVIVIKAMRSFSCGFTYYLTFQASLPDHPPQVFEAQLYDAPHWVSPLTIDFVRRKMHHPN